jgi:cysteinyl-tRNA synthetase
LEGAQRALSRLRDSIATLQNDNRVARGDPSASLRASLSEEKMAKIDEYNQKFRDSISNDLSMPQALAVAWEVVKSNIPGQDKLDLILQFDEVFGLNLSEFTRDSVDPPSRKASEGHGATDEIIKMLEEREKARGNKNFDEADRIRDELLKEGWDVVDTENGPKLKPASSVGKPAQNEQDS